jgi:hypothetical protein
MLTALVSFLTQSQAHGQRRNGMFATTRHYMHQACMGTQQAGTVEFNCTMIRSPAPSQLPRYLDWWTGKIGNKKKKISRWRFNGSPFFRILWKVLHGAHGVKGNCFGIWHWLLFLF